MLLFFAHPFCLSLSPLATFVLSIYTSKLSLEQRHPEKKDKRNPSYKLKEELAVSEIEIEMPQAPSTRWCPTPEQLMILEELYRSGVRTPDASQIQHITAHLSCYGRIEGKNVFYWFQNHKARERQKLRRRLSMHHQFLCSGYPLPILPPHRPMHLFQQDTPLLHPPSHGRLHQDAAQQGLNLLCKLESKGEEFTALSDNDQAYGCDQWMAAMEFQPTSCCSDKPLKTLDLFPTNSTALKDEGNTSKSSWPTSPS